MKKISLILAFICVCSQVLFSNNISDDESPQLQKGDWFTIEFANRLEDYSHPVDSVDYCASIDLKQLVLKCEVTEKSNNNLRLDFRFERVLDLDKNGKYYDSYFQPETEGQNNRALQNIVFNVDINLKNDSIRFLNATESDVYNYSTFSRTVNAERRTVSSSAQGKIIELKLVRLILETYLKDWQEQDYQIPLLSNGNIDVADYKKYRILESNLPVEHNFQLVVNIPDSLTGEELEIFETVLILSPDDVEKEIFNKKAIKGANSLSLYLPEQKLLMLRCGDREIKFIATPNDVLRANFDSGSDELNSSLVSKYQGDQEYLFHLINEPKYYRYYPRGFYEIGSMDSCILFLNEETAQLINTLDSFKDELTANFYKKQLLSVYYWAAAGIVSWCGKKEIRANYYDLSRLLAFQNIHPLYDYIFLPDNYDSYLRSVTYNSFRPGYESVSTNQWFTRNFNQIENYDIYDVLYWGYPKYLTLKNIVYTDIENNGIKSAQENYDKFLAKCEYPAFLNEIKNAYARFKRLEPGEPIAGLGLNFIKNENINVANGKFKVFLFADYISRNTAAGLGYNIGYTIEAFDLKNKIELYIISSKEIDRSVMQDIPNSEDFETIYINMGPSFTKVWEDMATLSLFFDRLLIISPDNKIVGRNIMVPLIKQGMSKYFEVQNQPKSHENRKAMILGALTSLLVTGFLAWLIIKINNRRIKKRESASRKLSELELKAIRSQMNPHFIFNAMGSIQNLMNHNQTEKANLYLSRFAKLMRMVLSSSNKKLVSLSDELELIRLYLELEQLRVDFQFKVEVGESVNPEIEEIPGMLLQPFVENAVIHGITPKGEGRIDVEISKAESNLVCAITDDGVGVDPARTGNGNGLAMKFAEKRVNLLSEQLKTRMKLEVENRNVSEGKSGTKVTLIIPVE